MEFEWDDSKNTLNTHKHGLSFYEAQDVFFDNYRIIVLDTKHSSTEKRYFCIGKTATGGIATVRFTIRTALSASSVPDIGGKGRNYMSKKINYTSAPATIEDALDDAIIVDDFLPTPKELVRKSEKERITIAIDKHSLDLFKKYAKQHDAKYQTMINGVLGAYADRFLNHSSN